VVNPRLLAHGAVVFRHAGAFRGSGFSTALTVLIFTGLIVLLIVNECGCNLEVFQFLVVRCRIVKGLLLIAAQYKFMLRKSLYFLKLSLLFHI